MKQTANSETFFRQSKIRTVRQQLDRENNEAETEECDANITDGVSKTRDPPRNCDEDEGYDDQKKHSFPIGTKRDWKQACHFVVGNPAAFQALKPPIIERTFL